MVAGGLSADTRQSSSQLPSNAQVIGYLLQSVNWYRHAHAERQVATDPADLLFLHDNEAIEEQILKLSFEYAKSDVALETTASSPNKASATPALADHPELAHFIELKNGSDQVIQKATEEVDTLNQRLAVARKADRKNLKAALDDTQIRLELAQAVSQTVNGLIEFVQSIGSSQAHTGNLDLTIDDLAQSMPELSDPAPSLAKLPTQEASSRTRTTDSGLDTGLLGLASEISALKRKLHVVDEKVRLTDNLARCAQDLRSPMTGIISRVIQGVAISHLETSNLSVLRQQKSQLDALTLDLKGFSPAIVALDKQRALLAEYKSHLLLWRTAVSSQYRQAWKNLVVRLLIVLLIIGLLIGTGETSRRLALRRIQDPNRRRAIGMIHRLAMLFAIALVALFSVASDMRSLATYFGLLTAGVAVALQNVIVAGLGYLLLNGKRGIRIGDRVQVSGVTGEVINMGLLQFQVKEIDVQKKQFTGHVATFSNSLVFVSPATGLLKFDSAALGVSTEESVCRS